MKQYRFFTTKENVDCYMRNKRDICCLEVEKIAESLRSYNHFIIVVEPDFTIHIFTYGGKHLVLK